MILKDIDGFVPSYKEANNSDDYNNGFADGVLFVMDELYHVPTVKAVPVSELKVLRDRFYENDGITMGNLAMLNKLIAKYEVAE
ncbi:MAG: hypothetical protein ACI3VM_01340 [Oscillospiraceae bacterium]